MKRRLVQLCVCLLLLAAGGAIVNVAVAWGRVLKYAGPWKSDRHFLFGPEFSETVNRFESADWTMPEFDFGQGRSLWIGHLCGLGFSRVSAYEGGSWKKAMTVPAIYEPDERITITAIDAGLPFHSLTGCVTRSPTTNALRYKCMLDTGEKTGIDGWPRYILNYRRLIGLPLRPLWPGFAINTLFYGAILWLLFYGPGFVRRRVRSMRNRCRACGYSLHNRAPDSTRCPECGALTPSPTGRGPG